MQVGSNSLCVGSEFGIHLGLGKETLGAGMSVIQLEMHCVMNLVVMFQTVPQSLHLGTLDVSHFPLSGTLSGHLRLFVSVDPLVVRKMQPNQLVLEEKVVSAINGVLFPVQV